MNRVTHEELGVLMGNPMLELARSEGHRPKLPFIASTKGQASGRDRNAAIRKAIPRDEWASCTKICLEAKVNIGRCKDYILGLYDEGQLERRVKPKQSNVFEYRWKADQ